MMKTRLTPVALALACMGLSADEPVAPPARASIGEVTVVVTAQAEVLDTVNTRVDAEQMKAFNSETVGQALNLLPGISLTVNARNEQMLYLRGNDSRQVPIFVDGIPVYVPYDGEMDYGRFTTFDLAEIQVAKGFSSVQYGPNTLGGAINLVTRRPAAALEGNVVAGVSEGDGKRVAANIGGAHDLFYYQVGGAYLSSDHWRMSGNFAPTANEDGGWRDHSDSQDRKLSLKFGLTPRASDEYVVGYMNQKGSKGNPVVTDPSLTTRYWNWPTWNKESVYLSTRTALGDQSDVKVRVYRDTYENTIDMFSSLWAQTGTSLYKDFTHGVMAEYETTLVPANSLRVVFQAKTDVHREASADTDTGSWLHYQDTYVSTGLEDSITLAPAWDLSLGAGMDQQRPQESGSYALPAPKAFYHGQAGLFWKPSEAVRYYLTIAQKEHFATLKDRYSMKLSTAIPNPGLKPETSVNYEVGVKATPNGWMQLEGALFLNDITDLIQSVAGVSGTKSQSQNVGKVRESGVELSMGVQPLRWMKGGLSYTYLDRDNVSNPATLLTGTPRNRATGYLRVEPAETVHVQAAFQAQDALWDNPSSGVYRQLGGFATYDLSAGWKPLKGLEVDAGLNNLFDRNYQLSSGYPLPGRNWFANARYSF